MSKKRRPEPVPADPLTPLFDSHTHLAASGATTPDAVKAMMDRAQGVGVNHVCTVGDGITETRAAVQASHWDSRVYAAAAIHPTRSAELLDSQIRSEVRELCSQERTVAVGECGLDWYWLDKNPDCADQDTQEEAFRWHISLAKDLDKPLMIHNRDADIDLLRILDDEGSPNCVILHCFSSGMKMARQSLDRGFLLSFSGSVTFKANEELREVAAFAPRGSILVETDAPYMMPAPYRGAANEPQYLVYTARALAEVRRLAPEDFAEQVTKNTFRAYGM